MALTLRIGIATPGVFESWYRSLKVGVSVADADIPNHLAHPTIEITLPLLDDEDAEVAGREAMEAVYRLLDAQVLTEWIERRRVAPAGEPSGGSQRPLDG